MRPDVERLARRTRKQLESGPINHGARMAWPVAGDFVPLTRWSDMQAEVWSYLNPLTREIHVTVVRISDNRTLTHVVVTVPREALRATRPPRATSKKTGRA